MSKMLKGRKVLAEVLESLEFCIFVYLYICIFVYLYICIFV